MSGKRTEATNWPNIYFSFCDDILGRNRRSMLNLDIFWWFLLLYGQGLFRQVFVNFFRIGRLGHF